MTGSPSIPPAPGKMKNDSSYASQVFQYYGNEGSCGGLTVTNVGQDVDDVYPISI